VIFSYFFFLLKYKMSAPAPVPPVAEPVAPAVPVAPPKKIHALTGRKPNEKQMEALRKGMEGLKKRREQIAKAKEEGTFNPEDFKPKPKVKVEKAPPKPRADPSTGIVRETIFVPRKKAEPKFGIDELKSVVAEMKASVSAPKEIIKEVPVERIVEREVVRETKISGREMLDAIFFRK
jgi:hypothetical protein